MAVSIQFRLQVWEGQSHTLVMQDPCDSEGVLGKSGGGRGTLLRGPWLERQQRAEGHAAFPFPGWGAQRTQLQLSVTSRWLELAG